MFVNGCFRDHILVLTFYLLSLIYVQYVYCEPKTREHRHLFPLLGYLHGYKIGQNLAYQLPPFVFSPVVILPTINQQQSVNVQKSTSGDNYHENGGTFQIISPSRLILLNVTEDNFGENDIENTDVNETKKIDSLKKSDLPVKINQSKCAHDTFRQVVTKDVTTEETTELTNENEVSTNNKTNSEEKEVSTQVYDLYSTTVHKNENISTLSITTTTIQDNFTSSSSLLQYNSTMSNTTMSNTNIENLKENIIDQNIIANKLKNQSNGSPENSKVNLTTASTSFRGYSYRNPWYNPTSNGLSITTSSYTNYESHLPLANDDRWQSFSSLRKSYLTSDFRPLAGLYHDGFFHKYPLKKTGFIPLNSKYLYYN